MRKSVAALGLASVVTLAGCDLEGPSCAEWRTESRLVTVTTLVNGKTVAVTQVQPVTFCVRYEEEGEER